jgi:hypothetical protein
MSLSDMTISKLQEDDQTLRGVAALISASTADFAEINANLLWSLLAKAYHAGRLDATKEICAELGRKGQ